GVEEGPRGEVPVVGRDPTYRGADDVRRQERGVAGLDQRSAAGGGADGTGDRAGDGWSDGGDVGCIAQRRDVGIGQALRGWAAGDIGGLRHDGDVVGHRFDAHIDGV